MGKIREKNERNFGTKDSDFRPVEEKLKDTYELIRERQPAAKEKKKKIPTVAAAVILVFLASTSVYAAFHSEFFEGMFGSKTKESVRLQNSGLLITEKEEK